MKRAYAKLGGQLGLACVGLGLLLIGLAWNGAAGIDFVSGQIPYLLSGGFLGLSLVILGVALAVIDAGRKNRAAVEVELRELHTAVNRLAAALSSGASNGHAVTMTSSAGDSVLLGQSSYHRLDCTLAEGKHLPVSTSAAAEAEGLTPCRICNPSSAEQPTRV